MSITKAKPSFTERNEISRNQRFLFTKKADLAWSAFIALGKNCDILMKNKKDTLRSVRSVLVYIREDEIRVPAEVIRKMVLFWKKLRYLDAYQERKTHRIRGVLTYVRGLWVASADDRR